MSSKRSGGNSVIGARLVQALLKERMPASPSGQVAYWRVSPVARRKLEMHKAQMEPLEGPAGFTTKWLAQLLEDLDAAATRARTSADAQEGRRAMLEKRKPEFRGD